ncbi:MAG: response regulator transcription factor [Deltaproteobacteria bacterium]|nr:response regulator transcription factor [Deltaproteobacteria bacterium]
MTDTSPAKILVVEDDENLRVGLCDNLVDEGYEVQQASTVGDTHNIFLQGAFDLVITDLMLPDGDGYELCRSLREKGHLGMVLMLTARTLEEDLVRGFDAGADDYLIKPYRLAELLVRVRALLRRRLVAPLSEHIQIGRLVVDKGANVISRDGKEVSLTKTEYDLFCLLLEHESRVLPRDVILDEVWGREVVVETRTVDNFVSSLKKKLDPDREFPFRIHTVRGVGYRFERSASS